MTHANFSNCEEQLTLAEFSFECTAIPAFWIHQNGSIFRVNQAACDALGYERDELQSLSVFDIDPSASQATWPNHWRKLKTEQRLTFTSRHVTKSGQVRPVEITVNFLKIGQTEFNFAFAKDLTAQHEAESALRETQERHALVIKAANDGIWDWDLATEEIYFSERWYSMLGLTRSLPIQSIEAWLDRIHLQDQESVRSKLTDYCAGKSEQLEAEFRIRHEQGHYLWVLCRGMALKDFNDQITRIAGSMTDITEQRHAQDQLLYEALHDPLTGLPNRNLLLNRLNEIILQCSATPESHFAVLFLDLDRFKLVNDSLGHRAGDQLLIEVAQRLQKAVSPEQTVARLGGDEFIVVLNPITHPTDAILIAKRILKSLSTPVYLDNQAIYPNVSIGITLSHSDPIDQGWRTNQRLLLAGDYIQQADIAMYQAKNSLTHSPYALFNTNMQSSIVQRLQLEADLQTAIERQEFALVYQPIVDLTVGQLVGFEALLRWHHPIQGLISPHLFIPVAEETGLIIAIGNWVLKEACRQMYQWQSSLDCNRDLFVTVNLASHHIMQPNFVTQVHRILNETRVDPLHIKLEITESAIIENKDFAREQILALRDRQIKVCLDDFGTGYSSLGYLHQLPIDCLKIDKSFVQKIQTSQDNPEIIRAILAIAQSLNMSVIAEGIETQQQAKLLREIGCPCGQGYLFDRPLSALGATRRLNLGSYSSQKILYQNTKIKHFMAS